MSWQARQESQREKREKTVVWRWLLGKSLTRNLRIQTESVPVIVSQKIIIIQQRAIVGPSCAWRLFNLSDLFNIATFERSPMRPAAVNIINGLKLKFVSHLISNKVPAAHLFRKSASEWFLENLLKNIKSFFSVSMKTNKQRLWNLYTELS